MADLSFFVSSSIFSRLFRKGKNLFVKNPEIFHNHWSSLRNAHRISLHRFPRTRNRVWLGPYRIPFNIGLYTRVISYSTLVRELIQAENISNSATPPLTSSPPYNHLLPFPLPIIQRLPSGFWDGRSALLASLI